MWVAVLEGDFEETDGRMGMYFLVILSNIHKRNALSCHKHPTHQEIMYSEIKRNNLTDIQQI